MALGLLILNDGSIRPVEAAKAEWKPVPGFEGLYEVSNTGLVRSLERTETIPNSTHWIKQRIRKARLLSQHTDRFNYNSVGLYKDGKGRGYRVGRLVASAFIPNPDNKEQVNHIDLNRQNNHVSNLEWTTLQENQAHRVEFGKVVKGEEMHSAKLTDEKVRELRRLYATGNYSSRGIGQMFGINQTTVLRVVRKETWKHV